MLNYCHLVDQCLQCFDTVGWASEGVGSRAYKNWVMRCWHGCLCGVRCKWFAYGPADATVTLSSLASLESTLAKPFWCQLTQVVLEKRPLSGCFWCMLLVGCMCCCIRRESRARWAGRTFERTGTSLFWDVVVGWAERRRRPQQQTLSKQRRQFWRHRHEGAPSSDAFLKFIERFDTIFLCDGWDVKPGKPAAIIWKVLFLAKPVVTTEMKDRQRDRHPFNGLFSKTTWVSWHQKG